MNLSCLAFNMNYHLRFIGIYIFSLSFEGTDFSLFNSSVHFLFLGQFLHNKYLKHKLYSVLFFSFIPFSSKTKNNHLRLLYLTQQIEKIISDQFRVVILASLCIFNRYCTNDILGFYDNVRNLSHIISTLPTRDNEHISHSLIINSFVSDFFITESNH
nr:MAG TPA: hypothetical protein [Caudoviricetes sp.]